MSQGYDDMRVSKKTLNRPIRDETVKQLFLSDSSSSLKEQDSSISGMYKNNSNDNKTKDSDKIKNKVARINSKK